MTTMKEVNEVLQQFQNPKITNKPVLGVRILAQQREQNGGFPMHLYHRSLDPVIVYNEDQLLQLQQLGYSTVYHHRDYPKMLHRRNPDPKFKANGGIESITVKTPEGEKELRQWEPPEGASEWVDKIADLPARALASTENPEVQIARLQEQLKAALENKKAK